MSKTKVAVVVKPDGEAEVIEFTDETSLKTLQTAVDGYIEAVNLDDEFVMWVNEEGLIRNDLKSNWLGAILYNEIFKIPNPIMGTVVFTGGVDAEGYTKGLTPIQVVGTLGMADVAHQAQNRE